MSRRLGAAYDKALLRAQMQMDQEMKNSVKKNKYGFSDPNAAIGFTRGMDVIVQPTPEEEENTTRERDATELTSPRLRKSLHAIEKLEQRDMEQDDRRKVTDMPLMGTEMDFVTKRTTNFSTVAIEEDNTFGLTAVEMYSMLAFNKPGIEIWKDFAGGDAADKDRHLELIESCRKYLELPVILKDENKEYIGLAKSLATSADLLQVSLTPAIGVQLVLAELLNRETKLEVNQPQTRAKE
ncbi:hypothetical protein MHU86_11506 [Fragilaria crotonensis]|nr:hypothetical protein MHU86_11506 [Fragilaria crotonensis]